MNAAKQRAEKQLYLVNQLADKFEASGIDYTCGRVVKEFVETQVTDEQIEASGLSPLRLGNRVWKMVQDRWQSRQ